MGTSDLSISISYDISFAEIPNKLEDYIGMITANAKMMIESHFGSLISDDLSLLNEDSIRRMVEDAVREECLLESSSAQSEYIRDAFGVLADSVVVSVLLSDTAETLKDKVVESAKTQITEMMQSSLGGA